MKNLRFTSRLQLAAIALGFVVFTIQGFSQTVTVPRNVSPAAELKQRIGLTDITVNYSRPRVTLRGNDRTGKIWGQQVPYGLTKITFGGQGEIPWRAGANENTTISFTDDVKIEGKTLAAGKYGVHMILHEQLGADGKKQTPSVDANKATIIFSRNNTSWGSFFYKQEEDALRVDVKTRKIPKAELLTYSVLDYGNNYAVLALSWEMKQIPFKIEIDTAKTVLANFRKELRSLPGFGWRGYLSAAQYCANNNMNHEEALKWADIALSRNKSFPTYTAKAQLLFQTGKEVEGDKMLDGAASLATRPQINAVGYQLLGQKRFVKAIQFLTLNVKSDPTDANAYDSLGEAYKLSGDKANAIVNLKKALTLNPAANVKANSEKLLKELGAM